MKGKKTVEFDVVGRYPTADVSWQAEVQASICVSIGEKRSLVLSALTMIEKLVECESRVEGGEQQWDCCPEDGQKCLSVRR